MVQEHNEYISMQHNQDTDTDSVVLPLYPRNLPDIAKVPLYSRDFPDICLQQSKNA